MADDNSVYQDTRDELLREKRYTELAWQKHFAHPDPRDPDYSPPPNGETDKGELTC